MYTAKHKHTIITVVAYISVSALTGVYVFVENDESKPLGQILLLNSLIPCLIYSLASVWISIGSFLWLKSRINQYWSFAISIFIGVPVGLMLVRYLLPSFLEAMSDLLRSVFF